MYSIYLICTTYCIKATCHIHHQSRLESFGKFIVSIQERERKRERERERERERDRDRDRQTETI